MVAQASLWDNPEFMEWFNARPEKIQALIRQCPPDREYRVQGGAFPGRIYSYDEEEGGGVSMKVNIESPLFPRTVFGLKPEHLEPWVDDPVNAGIERPQKPQEGRLP